MFYGGKVHDEQYHEHDEARNPLGNAWQPVLHIEAGCREVGHSQRYPAEPVGPPGNEGGSFTKIFIDEVYEGMIAEIREQNFAECTHYEEAEYARDEICEQD